MTLTATYRVEAQTPALDIHGNGRVAQALIHRAKRHNIPITSVHDSRGPVHQDTTAWGRPVFVDCTAPAYDGPRARAWIDHLESTLYRGVPIVTCNKAPLALAWSRLEHAARVGRTRILASATVGAGTPVLEGVAAVRDAHGVQAIEASLSGTLSYVVHAITQGHSETSAVRCAQEAGYAEPDPTLDLDGTDALAKAVILHNIAFRDAPRQAFSPTAGTLVNTEHIRNAHDAGLVPEFVAKIRPGAVTLALQARPAREALAPRSGHVAVRATSHDGQVYEWRGPGAGVHVTADAVLRDVHGLEGTPRIGIRP